MERTWSAEQTPIFDWFATGEGNLVVEAFAGTGKTTTIIEGVRRAPEQAILLCAFSKIIERELTARIAGLPNVVAKTLHGVGYACVRNFRDRIKVDFSDTRANDLAARACGKSAPDAILRLVAKLCTKGREIAPHATKPGDLADIQIRFECEPDENWTRAGFGPAYVEAMALKAMELASEVKSGDTIDGSDMIFLPVRNGWLVKQYDMAVVDEAQDMTTAQLEIALGVCGGRICVVGDSRQAIFGFRGADSESLNRLRIELKAASLGLTTTYRCGQAIVEAARAYVPAFRAAATNGEGLISGLDTAKLVAAAGPGDFILSRVNAPLVSTAMQLLRAGKRARVAGRDIGKGLQALIRKMKASSVPQLLSKIEGWAAKEKSRLTTQAAAAQNGRKAAIEAKIDAVLDQADMLISLADGAKNVAEVEGRIEALFTDPDGVGVAGVITCSSVHRAKGLEADRVFILRDTLRGGDIEEENIAYVAITRAKKELVWVSDKEAR